MKRSILLSLFVLVFIGVKSQTYDYSYTYDDAGNRTSRTITIPDATGASLLNEETGDLQESREVVPVTDRLLDKQIRLYPNPTRGELVLQITPFDGEDPVQVLVYDINGKLVHEQQILFEYTSLDFTDFKPGNYILKLKTDHSENSYLIIKK